MIGYQRMIELGRSRLPVTFTADGHASPQEDWRVLRAAFVARVMRTAEALAALVPIDARLDAMGLARTRLEHVACMAWIAADPDARFEVWLKKDYSSRLDYDKERRRRIDAGEERRWAEPPLADADRAAYTQLVRRVAGDLPGLPKLFKQADDYWLARYPAGLADHPSMSLLRLYEDVYDSYSWLSHPRLTGLQSFWDPGRQWVVVHAQETDSYDHDPLHMGQLLVGLGLLIASMAWGCADVDEVVDVLNSNAQLALAVRNGELVTVEVRPGHFRLEPRE
jgi:hypothetical protein